MTFGNVISLQLGRHEDALDFAIASHSFAPSKSEVAERVENVKKDIALGMDKMVFMAGFSYKVVYIVLLHFYFCMHGQIHHMIILLVFHWVHRNMLYLSLMWTNDIRVFIVITSKIDTENSI